MWGRSSRYVVSACGGEGFEIPRLIKGGDENLLTSVSTQINRWLDSTLGQFIAYSANPNTR